MWSREKSSLKELNFEMTVDPYRETILESNLMAYNRDHARQWSENRDERYGASPLHVFVHDHNRQLVAGLIARTHAIRSWLEVTVLWVEESHRGKGLGRELMVRAEDEARRRGCNYARLASSDYQAPAFYEALGYRIYGKLENCPPGDTSYYLCKNLLEPLT